MPWALSSQVFHTTTGLRAVDPEAAQTLNPYRRIGKLAIGHLLFRLQENEYVTVEIKSIDRAKQLFESAFTLSLVGDLQAYHADGYCMFILFIIFSLWSFISSLLLESVFCLFNAIFLVPVALNLLFIFLRKFLK